MLRFRDAFNAREGLSTESYADLHGASIERRDAFWSLVWDFCEVHRGQGRDRHRRGPHARGAFFPQARLNFAENLLRRDDDGDAIVFRGEDKASGRLSLARAATRSCRGSSNGSTAQGVGPGDRVAAMMPNMPETVALMLAATSLGAVWSSCSPDFGARGVLDRFGQIEPKVFIACDGYWYAGKRIDVARQAGRDRAATARRRRPC